MLTSDPLTGSDHELLARYTAAAGSPVSPAALALYRLWWTRADIAAFVADRTLRAPTWPTR
ncbi:hypothetical protein Ais01nite_25230 [Asanoa ishikariensis]|uniref:Uncharacterized protein n=1 Tax=Asanoa ishikariensis TaxID=137265 RepID=A0A1H3R2G6_9ACTN|nr:hypothetical protein [Asanoa ishikariensis]GIF64488.1 hypothetical protein Ais01nite_25230 [Asanoa ishikariensis]SDZ19703.1 hypothetical protein SAMN05421684_3396 [Asanoa ishikariensis]